MATAGIPPISELAASEKIERGFLGKILRLTLAFLLPVRVLGSLFRCLFLTRLLESGDRIGQQCRSACFRLGLITLRWYQAFQPFATTAT